MATSLSRLCVVLFYHSLIGVAAEILAGHPLDVVHRDPDAARDAAEALLAAPASTTRERSIARWTLGLVERESSRHHISVRELRIARDLARSASDVDLHAEVSLSLAHGLSSVGEVADALEIVQAVGQGVAPGLQARCATQRALLLYRQGRLAESLPAFEAARSEVSSLGDEATECRLLADQGLLLARTGRYEAARSALERSAELARAHGLRFVRAVATHNLAFVDSLVGDVPSCLRRLRAAERLYEAVGNPDGIGLVMADRGIVYGDVGLLAEARSAIASAIAVLRETGNRSDLAEVLLLAAELDAGDDRAEAAVRFAEEAAALFDRTGRARLALRAELTKLEGLAAVAVEPTEVAGRAIEVGDRLARSSWRSDAATAYAVAAWVARRSDPELVALAKRRYDRLRPQAGGREAIRVSAAMAAAALELGDRRRSRRWVTAGLAAAVERGHSLGAADMRSGLFASRFVGELAWVGIELAISDGRAREALSRSESVRLAAHVPPSREGDHVLSDLLTELRRVRSEARSVEDHASLAVLDTERRSLEDRIRSTARERVPTTAVSARSLGERLRSESATTFIELVEHGADVVVIQADSKHVRLRGRFGSARLRSDLESLGFAVQRLHRTATSRASRAASYELLQQTAEDIERSVFGSDHSLKTDRLVIVPGGAACDVAWNSLPISREHVVSISPAIVTLRPRERDINDGSLVAISGPGLVHSADEVRRIADIANGRVLAGPQAVTGAVLNALSEARVCHLACHGKFRGDNPLFSALDLHDGPLTVYDLEQCDRVPEVVVLSACDVGRADAAGGSVLLGFATALLDLGVRWVVAPLTPVNDERSVALMVRLHEHLAAGVDAATALHSASVHSDGSLDPTAAPFLCFGS